MFNKKVEEKQELKAAGSSNTIGKGTILTGDMVVPGNMRIEGTINGNIQSKSKVVLGNGAKVEGNIVAQNAEIEGEIVGKVEISEILYLRATANVKGDIYASKVVMEAGAKMSGKVEIGNGSAKPLTALNKNGQYNGKKVAATV
ncbi:MAG: cytoskeletal protein CcmA (bactofilin family) [Flammeovirgaceae bacterium]|jgi:cytoskeletal protein CcmA (bactofilin family)